MFLVLLNATGDSKTAFFHHFYAYFDKSYVLLQFCYGFCYYAFLLKKYFMFMLFWDFPSHVVATSAQFITATLLLLQ
jgi:hypothetical protein